MAIIEYDLDGTICVESNWRSCDEARCYETRTPNREIINTIRELIDAGHIVVIHTARRERWRTLTEQWLNAHGVYYHYLFMNKLISDRRVDDQNRTNDEIKKEFLSNEADGQA